MPETATRPKRSMLLDYVATFFQFAAVVLFIIGLAYLQPFLAVAAVLGIGGYLMAPDR